MIRGALVKRWGETFSKFLGDMLNVYGSVLIPVKHHRKRLSELGFATSSAASCLVFVFRVA